MRSGIQSLDRGQREAAASLGLTYRQQMRFVILPQGLRRMVPATVSQLITLNKDTTLVSIIAIQEVIGHAGSVTSASAFFGGVQAPLLQVYLMVGFFFIVVNFSLSRLSRRLEIRERKRTGTTLAPRQRASRTRSPPRPTWPGRLARPFPGRLRRVPAEPWTRSPRPRAPAVRSFASYIARSARM